MARKAVTVYLDEAAYQRLGELIAPKTISRELDDLIRKRIAELEGKEYDPPRIGGLRRTQTRV